MYNKTSQIGLIGATGKAGSVILSELLRKNFKVTVLVRDHSRLKINDTDNLTIIIGDAADASKTDELVNNTDVIIDASNSRKGEPPLVKVLISHLIPGIEGSQKRLFLLAGKTVKAESDSFSLFTSFERLLLTCLFPDVMKAKAESLALLQTSSAKWTMIRCPLIVDDESEHYHSSLTKCGGKSISRRSISAFILNEIENEQFLFKAPFLYNI